MRLIELGWNDRFEKDFEEIKKEGCIPARVSRVDKGRYVLLHEYGECTAKVSGKLRHDAQCSADFPAVGDWVAMMFVNGGDEGIIYRILPRKSCFKRKAPVSGGRKVRDVMGRKITLGGVTEEQIIASNIDFVFIVIALDHNYNLRRIERYLLIAYNSGAVPVIILNKCDLCENTSEMVQQVEEIAMGADIHTISALNGNGVDALKDYLDNNTVGFFGSSGVGKSTLINAIIGHERLKTGDIRSSDSKGRHTTTWREMVLIDGGGVLIDTPGMREVQVWCGEDEVSEMFEDIIELESRCRFRDCSHKSEPGCAIREALDNGTLQMERYQNYLFMLMETSYLEQRIVQREREKQKCKVQFERYNSRKRKQSKY